MKYFCLILSLFVLALSWRPCCADEDCSGKISNKIVQESKKDSPSKNCGDCSPFFSCGSCSGFFITKKMVIALPVPAENPPLSYPAYRQPFIKEITLSIWQPPRLG